MEKSDNTLDVVLNFIQRGNEAYFQICLILDRLFSEVVVLDFIPQLLVGIDIGCTLGQEKNPQLLRWARTNSRTGFDL